MGQVISIVFQIITFLATHKDQIKQLILDIEALMPDAAGSEKATQVKTFIAAALSIEAQVEQAWSFVGPIFNRFVAATKSGNKQ
jgi:hypothetical protein